ncbi:MAG: hypothetical protein KDJ65_06965 [Anaerolineae bacterium]|nr:hypothetical protein [Anaerolineae bacterium]
MQIYQHTRGTRFILILLLSFALWLLVACGGNSATESPPAEDAPIATEPAATEAEATEATTETAADEESSAEAAAENVPAATVAQVVALLNLRTLEMPDGATAMGQSEAGSVNLQVAQSVTDVVDFYRSLLSDQGWQEAEDGYVDAAAATLYFTKDDFAASLSASDMGDGSSTVSLMHHGNISPSTLPQTADAETSFAAPNMFMYFSPTSVTDVARFVRTELANQGWHEYTRPNTATADDPNSQTRSFIQNGLELTAFISTAPAQDNKTAVQYTVLLLPLDMPVEPEADAVELDKSPIYLHYQTPASLDAVAEFYRQEMVALGWEEVTEAAVETPEQVSLTFANTDEEMALQLLLTADDNQTVVTLGAGLAAPMAEGEDDAESDSLEAETDSSDTSSLETETLSTGDIPAAPLPDDATTVKFDPDGGELTFTTTTDLAGLAEFYRQEMAALGWEEDTFFAMESESFTSLDFTQGDETVSFSAFDMVGDIEATLDLSNAPSLTGISAEGASEDAGVTTEPSADAPTFTINDWPTPPAATEVNVAGELLSYKVAMPLADLAEFYRPTFEMMDLGTSCLDDAADYTSLSCSSGNGDVMLNFFAFEGFEDTEVEIDFTNYNYPVESSSSGSDSGELTAELNDGFPLPSDNTGYFSEGTEFSRNLVVTSPSDTTTLLEFYQAELSALGWQEEDSSVDGDTTTVTFSGPDGNLTLTLTPSGGETEIGLASKNPTAAEEAGVLPPAEQARLFLINFSEEELTVTVNDQEFDLAVGAGMDSPDTAPNLDLPPGSYTVSFTVGGQSLSDSVEVGPNEAWGLMLDAEGVLPLQVY